jgi:ribosomal protein S19E (S16A)
MAGSIQNVYGKPRVKGYPPFKLQKAPRFIPPPSFDEIDPRALVKFEHEKEEVISEGRAIAAPYVRLQI